MRETPKCNVSGGKLGYAYTKQAVGRSFGGTSLEGMSNREVLKAARNAIALESLSDLQDLASALETCSKYGIANRADAITRARAMEAKAEQSFSDSRAIAAAAEIREASQILASYGLLPEKGEPRTHPNNGRRRASAHVLNGRNKELETALQRQRGQRRVDRGER